MQITRKWAMPNSKTFTIKPIKELIEKHIKGADMIVDPFANVSKLATVTNDLDMQYDTDYHLDALEFLKMFDDKSVDVVLYDPPYSLVQLKTCYKELDKSANFETTNQSYWDNIKQEMYRIVKPNGKVLSFGWCSEGVGDKYGFNTEEILIVPHGGWHNDTICVVDVKNN